MRRSPGPPVSRSSIVCSMAASYPGRSRSWPGNRVWARARSSSRRSGAWPSAGHGASSSPPRNQAPRYGCGPSASGRSRRTCSSCRRPRCRMSSPTSSRCSPTCWRSTRSRPSSIPTYRARPVRSHRSETARTGSYNRRKNVSSRRCSWATSRRKARSRGRACWSTSSTPCSRSTAIADTRCGCCTRSSTASAAPTNSVCSR